MALEVPELLAAPSREIVTEVPGRAKAEVRRVLRTSSTIAPGAAALMLVEHAWQSTLGSVAEARSMLTAARDGGVVGVVVLGSLRMPVELISVFRQLKLYLGSVPGLAGCAPEEAAELLGELQSALDQRAEHEQHRLEIVERLLAAMNDAEPISAVVEQLGRQCEGAALLYDGTGAVVESTGAAPAHLVYAEIARRELSAGGFSVGRWNVICRGLTIRAQSYVLVLASRATAVFDAHGRFMLDTVARLLGSFQALESFAMIQQVQNSAQLLREIELGIPPGKEKAYWDRLVEFGFTPFSSLRYVTASTGRGRGLTSTELSSLTRFAAESRTPVLVSENARTGESMPGFRMLAEGSEALDMWLTGFSGAMAIGVSQEFSQLSTAPEEARSAQLGENLARQRLRAAGGRGQTVVHVDRLAPADWLLARAHSVRDRSRLAAYVRGLRENDELFRTLLVHFSADLRIAEAARRLGVHQNTVRYRLARIEEVLGIPLGRPSTITNLYLALHDDLLESESEGERRGGLVARPRGVGRAAVESPHPAGGVPRESG